MDGDSRLTAYRSLAETRLAALLPTEDAVPQKLHEAMRYSALAPGKRLRPALCMAAAEAVGADPEIALDAGCAAELVHAFSLIHDDLPAIDDDDLRRGRPTCHVVFGEAMALLGGDALFALAFQVLGEAGYPAEMSLCLARASGSRGLVGGEVLDVLSEGLAPDLELLKTIHARKTGALIAASCEMGARAGGGDPVSIEKLRDYGEWVGLAFQIADDILNETSTPEELGKAVGSDRERGKQTYPAAMGIEASYAAAEEAVAMALAQLEGLAGDVEPVRDLARYAIRRKH